MPLLSQQLKGLCGVFLYSANKDTASPPPKLARIIAKKGGVEVLLINFAAIAAPVQSYHQRRDRLLDD